MIRRGKRLFLVTIAVLMLAPLVASRAMAQAVSPARWMTELAEEAAAAGNPASPLDQTLAQFIFPGSHLSGTYGIPDFDIFDPFDAPPLACNKCIVPGNETILETPGLDVLIGYLLVPLSKTQELTIRQQLDAGARALDLRFFRANASDHSRSPELATGQYYIHRTFAGVPTQSDIFNQIKAYLDVSGNEKEIILLNFSQMYEGNAEMSTSSLQSFFTQLFATVGASRFAPKSVGHGATIKQLAAAGTQIIVTYSGNTALSDPAIMNLVWAPLHTRFFSSPDVNTSTAPSYPKVERWDTERELFNWLKIMSQQRPDDNAMYQMYVNMGVDDGSEFPDMGSRSLMCNVIPIYDALKSVIDPITMIANWLDAPPKDPDIETDYWEEFKTGAKEAISNAVLEAVAKAALEAFMDQAGICPAINDDWDRFISLEELADYTNPKVLPSLVGLLRKNVNIVMADYYPSAFTAEVKRLNQGAARLTVTIKDVYELECHDCFPPNGPSAPDYFPEISFWPNGITPPANWHAWPLYPNEHDILDPGHVSHWGGPWLEKSGRHIYPNWQALRSLSPNTPSTQVQIRIWDQDNNNCVDPIWCGWDDDSQINGGSTVVTLNQPIWNVAGAVPQVLPANYTSRGRGDTGWFEFDSSQFFFNIDVCQWSHLPGQSAADKLCGLAGFLGNNPPVAEFNYVAPPIIYSEGSWTRVSGRLSDDFDPPVNGDGDPIGSIVSWEFDCDYNGIEADFMPNQGCSLPETYQEDTVGDGLQDSGFSFYPADGPANKVLALRVTDAGGLSDIATRPYQVLNQAPRYGANISVLAQEGPGSRIVNASAYFFDPGLDEFPITCAFSEGATVWPGEVTDFGRLYTDTEMVGQYRCTASFGLSYGVHTINFVATDKDGASGPPSSNQIDVLPAAGTVTLAEALDSPDIFNVYSDVGGQADWPFIGVVGETHTGEIGDIALSGPTAELRVSDLGAFVTGPGWITFWWKVTGDEYDEMKFYLLPGGQKAQITGRSGWQQFGINIPAGTYELAWQYKDGYLGPGNGSGAVDDVVFTPAPTITLSNTLFPNGVIGVNYPATAITQTGGSQPTTFAISNGSLPPGLNLSVAGIVSGTPTTLGEFQFTVTATESHGYYGSHDYQISVRTVDLFKDGFEAVGVPAWTVTGGLEDPGRLASTWGVEFTPVQDLELVALGFYESAFYHGGPVGIWRVSDKQLLDSVVIPDQTGGTIIGKYRYINLPAPLTLGAGVAYRVGGWFRNGENSRLWQVNHTLNSKVVGGALYYHTSLGMEYPDNAWPTQGPGPNFLFK